MALNNVNIYCQGFSWVGLTNDPRYASFFSGITPNVISDKIDLINYITEDSEENINYDFDFIDEQLAPNKYQRKSSDFSCEIVTINPDINFIKYFRFFEDRTYIKFLIEIFYNNNLIFKGVVYPDGLNWSDPEDDNIHDPGRTLNIDVAGFEREFAEYFSSKKLPAGNDFSWDTLFTDNAETVKAKNFQMLLTEMFSGVAISMSLNLAEWMIAYDATFQYASFRGLYFPPVGYVQIQRDGSCDSCYDFLQKICNGMGWTFRFIYNNNIPSLKITDRSLSNSFPVLTVSAEKIIGINSVSADSYQAQHKYIIIAPCVDLTGGDSAFYSTSPNLYDNKQLKGDHDIIISKDNIFNLNSFHFSSVSVFGSAPLYRITRNTGISNFKYRDQTEFEKKYTNQTWNGSIYTFEFINIAKSDLLSLDCGHNTRDKRRVNFYNKNVSAFSDPFPTPDEHDLIFSGCFASALFKYQAIQNQIVKEAYTYYILSRSYVNSSTFLNNMRALFNTYTKMFIEISVKEVILEPIFFLSLIGHDISELNRTYLPLAVSVNLFNETTNLKLMSL